MIGTDFGAILIGIAFALHTASITTALVPSFECYRDRLIFTALSGMILALVVYWPAGALFGSIATPLSINQTLRPVAEGDVVWFHPTAHVSAGDFALYNSVLRDVGLRGNYGHGGRFIMEAGMRISRVIATGGQTISWDKKTMLLNGVPASTPLGPLGFAAIWPTMKVPEDYVLIDPSNLVPGGVPTEDGQMSTTGEIHGQAAAEVMINRDHLQSFALVPVASVLGKVIWRSWPFSCPGFLN